MAKAKPCCGRSAVSNGIRWRVYSNGAPTIAPGGRRRCNVHSLGFKAGTDTAAVKVGALTPYALRTFAAAASNDDEGHTMSARAATLPHGVEIQRHRAEAIVAAQGPDGAHDLATAILATLAAGGWIFTIEIEGDENCT